MNLSVRNPEGVFVNSETFREEAKHFLKYGYYCADTEGTQAHTNYWTEQLRRIKEGYTSGGVYITGAHYNYLNFIQIKLTESTSYGTTGQLNKTVKSKTVSFPAFWDGDYNYFHILDIAREGCTPEWLEGLGLFHNYQPLQLTGQLDVVIGKARRKGYSYKNAALALRKMNTYRNSSTFIHAYDSEYYKDLFAKIKSSYAFQYKNCYGLKREFLTNNTEELKIGYTENGVDSGYLSRIKCITYKNSHEAGKGKDSDLSLYEEAGVFPNLIEARAANVQSHRDGIYQTGQQIFFGTGGKIEGAGAPLVKLFYNPYEYKCIAFKNEWENELIEEPCSFYMPAQINFPGCYDEQGNSDTAKALQYMEDEKLSLAEHAENPVKAIGEYIQENSTKPSESFLMASMNDFPTKRLRDQLSYVRGNKLQDKRASYVTIKRHPEDPDSVITEIDFTGKLKPVKKYRTKKTRPEGCLAIYEQPNPNAAKGTYKIGYDPVALDQGTSLACILVYKSPNDFSTSGDKLVAMYIGRLETTELLDEMAICISILYNGDKIMHENYFKNTISYAQKVKSVKYLADPPTWFLKTYAPNTKVDRLKGVHLPPALKFTGLNFINSRLRTQYEFDEELDRKRDFVDGIFDERILEELLAFNELGNFDVISAWVMVEFQIANDREEKKYGRRKDVQESDRLYDKLQELQENSVNSFFPLGNTQSNGRFHR